MKDVKGHIYYIFRLFIRKYDFLKNFEIYFLSENYNKGFRELLKNKTEVIKIICTFLRT